MTHSRLTLALVLFSVSALGAAGCSSKKRSSSSSSSTTAATQSSTNSGTTSGTNTNTAPVGPHLASVTPQRGNPYGGTAVTLRGLGFEQGSKVRFGTVEASAVQVTSGDVLECVSPAHPVGLVDVEVELPSGQLLRLNNAFEFDPNAGPFARSLPLGSPTAEEHELLELINRARRDPPAEGVRLGLDFSAIAPRPPLTHAALLGQAALAHSLDMAARAFYGHLNPDGVGPVGRVLDTGYALHSRYGTNRASNTIENVGAASGNLMDTPQKVHDLFMIDAGVNPPKHRQLLLGVGNFKGRREAGFGYRNGLASAQAFTSYVTEELAASQRDLPILLGTAYTDTSNDGVCRAGEGVANLPVVLTHSTGLTVTTQTNAVGAYAFELYLPGTWTLSIDGKSTAVVVGADNVQVDLVGNAIRTY